MSSSPCIVRTGHSWLGPQSLGQRWCEWCGAVTFDPRPSAPRRYTRRELHCAACHYCRARLTPRIATTEHVQPVSRGGTNDPDNLVPAVMLYLEYPRAGS